MRFRGQRFDDPGDKQTVIDHVVIVVCQPVGVVECLCQLHRKCRDLEAIVWCALSSNQLSQRHPQDSGLVRVKRIGRVCQCA